jgi:hypothetical protein
MSEDQQPQSFNSMEEYVNWGFENLSKAIVQLTERVTRLEQAVQKIPPPGPDMIKYKIPETEHYSNLKELLDNIYDRIGTLEGERDCTKDRLNKLEDS